MSELAIMALISVIGTVVSGIVTSVQNQKSIENQQNLMSRSQEYNTEREDVAYGRSLPVSQLQRFIDAGFNPNLAANSILGGNGNQVDPLSSPAAPSVNSAADALSGLFGKGMSNLQNAFKDYAEINNLNANTEKQNIESGLLPRDYQLRVMSTDAQIRLWTETADKYCEEAKLTKEQTDLVKQQNLYYGRLSTAQIQAYEAQVREASASAMLKLEQINTEEHKQQNLDSSTMVNYAQEQNIEANTTVQWQEAYSIEVKTEREKIARDFEKSLGGIPLTADAQKYVQKLVSDGDIVGVQNFYQAIFSTALNQEVGKSLGTGHKWGLPFNIYQSAPSFAPTLMDPNLGPRKYDFWTPQFILPN